LPTLVELLTLAGSIATVTASIGSLAYWLGRKFAEVDERFKEMGERFKAIDRKFEQIDRRFEQVDARFEQINRRFEEISSRLREVDRRLESVEARVAREVRRLGTLFVTYQDFLVDFLSLEGVIRSDRASFLKAEARRLLRLAHNPLTRGEWRRLAELLDKDRYTPEEAEELLELAKKARDEYWDREEAWRLYIFARIVYAETHYRRAEGKT